MENGKYNKALVVFGEKDFVGKASGHGASNLFVDKRVLLGRPGDRVKGSLHAQQEGGAESGNPIFEPLNGLFDVRLGFGADDERLVHRVSRSLTMLHGDPSPGFF